MTGGTKAFLFALKKEVTVIKTAFFLLIVLLAGNLNAIVDSVLHSEIPYFDHEHVIVGSTYALLLSILLLGLGSYYVKRKQAETALKKSEEQYRNIFDNARDIIFTITRDALFASLNPAVERITGWQREEWLGKSFSPVIHPDDLPKAVGILQKIMQEETVEMFELRVLKKSGEYFIGEFTVAPIRQGETVTALGHVRDITDRKQAEKRLQQERDKARKYLDIAGVMLVVVDLEQKVVLINKKGCEILGYNEEEIVGENWFESFLPKSDRDRVTAVFYRLAAEENGSLEYVENNVLTKSGEERLIVWHNSVLKDENGNVIGTLSSGEDITERKRVKDSLQESEERFRRAINATQDGLWEWNIQTNQEFFAPRWCEIVGYSFDDPELPHTYNSWASRIHPADYDCVMTALKNHLEKGARYDVNYRHRHKSGEYRWQNTRGQALFDESGKPIKMVGCISDITERKQWEVEICKLNEELEMKVEERTRQLIEAQDELIRKEKLAFLGQLSGSVGHELRNPLGVISNAVYFLQTTLSGADETVKEYLDIIKSEVSNSMRIISDLLDFSRARTPRTSSIPVHELIRQSLDKCSIPEGITVDNDIPEGLPSVSVDPFQMVQVFQNLIMNAVQAMPDGGSLRINARLSPDVGATRWVALEEREKGRVTASPLQKDNNFIEISITDTGEGISPENISRLFQPLFTTKARGIGLGLTISKRIIEANNGSIEVQSRTGQGTTFTVILPVEK